MKKIIYILFFFISCSGENPSEHEIKIVNDFYPNGEIKHEGKIINGLKEGVHKWYYENGKLDSEVEYVHGVKNGLAQSYYENGVKKSKAFYANGNVVDTIKFYYSNGNIKSIYIYNIEGLKKKYLYSEDGSLFEERSFINVHFIDEPFLNTWINYNENGKVNFDDSHYYKILNGRETYDQNSISELELEYYSFNNEKHILILGDIGNSFFYDESEVKFSEIQPPYIKIPIPTEKLGKQTLRFIIDDYKIIQDSLLDIKHVFGEYKYEVVK
jgi:hypothetical protein